MEMTPERMNEIKLKHTQRQLSMCDDLLTAAGVPKWVLAKNNGVPANSIPSRLQWFLARRKNVKPSEIDKELQRDLTVYNDYHPS